MFRQVFTGNQTMRVMRDMADHLGTLHPDKKYSVELKEHREKRSLNANSFAWALIGQIANKMGISPEEVYRQSIMNSGTYTVMPVRDEALDDWRRVWEGKGVGWLVEVIGPTKTIKGYTACRCWYGSSVFDRTEMAHLIDNLVQDAKGLGIDTSTPAERARLLEEWECEKQ